MDSTAIAALLPDVELRGEGKVTYRCFACGDLILGASPIFAERGRVVSPLPTPLTLDVRAYHAEHKAILKE